MHLDDLLRPWVEPLRREVPGLAPVDCHTHLGRKDPDGFSSEPEELLTLLGNAGARGVVFPMQEPSGYPGANDWVRAVADESDGVLVPFCRVDPHADGVGEARRSLDAGARGIKLHPRSEAFRLADPEVLGIFEVAAERGVPVLTHAGRGIPALGRDALAISSRFPDTPLILAHAGVSDLSWLWRHAPEHPTLLFDTAWWSPADLLALFALVPPGQIVFGSDAPYGTSLEGLILTLRGGLQVGLAPDQVRSIAGGQMERILAGEPPADIGPPPGAGRLPRDVLLDRLHSLLAVAVRRSLHGEMPEQELALARLACEVGDDAPHAEAYRSALALIDLAEKGLSPREGAGFQHPASHVIVIACMIARTPDPPLPRGENLAAVGSAATLPRSVDPD